MKKNKFKLKLGETVLKNIVSLLFLGMENL